ncbi:hypothetical protein ATANTOWER_022318, partial [Ataeniobius toweri]|nr:hypothetical protein [Ataeniobius toweri]
MFTFSAKEYLLTTDESPPNTIFIISVEHRNPHEYSFLYSMSTAAGFSNAVPHKVADHCYRSMPSKPPCGPRARVNWEKELR